MISKNIQPNNDILIVDDSLGDLKLLSDILILEGYSIRPATNATIARRSIQAKLPAMILLDIKMPDTDGFELCREIKADKLTSAIPIIFCSALDDGHNIRNGFQVGAVDYISKPFQAEEVVARIATHLKIKNMQTNLQKEVNMRTQELFSANEKLKQETEKLKIEIKDRILAEKRLRENEELLNKVLDTIPLGVWFTNKEGKIIYGNTAGQKIWQGVRYVEPDQFHEYKGWWMDSGRRISTEEWGVFRAIKYKEESLAEKIEIECFDGSHKYILNWAIPIKGKNDSVEGAISVNQDITDQVKTDKDKKKLEEQLQQAQKMEAVATLAGGIAHDFNNILGIISGNISYALPSLDKNDELFELLSDVQEGAKQAQNLTQQLLTFSKGGAPIKEVADLNHLIKEAALFVTRGAESKCEFNLDRNLWAAKVDKGQINQVIANLVINAIQAMPKGGTIYIGTENKEIHSKNTDLLAQGKYIKITVEDNGVGISENHLSNIFDPFFTTKQKGSGLGLATAYSIIKRHGGNIRVYSELDKGTTFIVYLPASESDFEKIETNGDENHDGKGKILIMDDQKPILKMAGRMLNRMGYDTEFATDGAEAIKLYRKAHQTQEPFKLVILDLTVPGGMGGARTIPELLKIDPKIKVVVSSGYSNDPIMASYEDYGFCGVIPKPYRQHEMAELLNKIFFETE